MAKSCTSDTSVIQRRRQLFPSYDEDSDDLGHVIPLYDGASVNSQECSFMESEAISTFNTSSISDYVILENINNVDAKSADVESTPDSPPLKMCSLSDGNLSDKDDTPSRRSSFTLKTPQDASSANTDVPKLIRKSPFKSCSAEAGKRKLEFSSSPTNAKHVKLDHASPKARTALFPKSLNEILLPTKSFYSKPSSVLLNVSSHKTNLDLKKNKSKSASVYLCKKKGGNHRFGQINAGVRHKIRKPKPKQKFSNAQLLKAALSIIEKSEISEHDDQISCVDFKPLKPDKISVKENIEQIEEELDAIPIKTQKRALSPPPDESKKFFKHRRSNATVTVEKHMKLKVDDGKISFLDQKKIVKKRKIHPISFDVTDLTIPENDGQISEKIDDILLNLCNDKENISEEDDSSEQFVLHAYNSVTMSENSIHLHSPLNDLSRENLSQTSVNNILLSPTSVMCNMTSGLALNSPDKLSICRSDLGSFNDIVLTASTEMEHDKLFPIFYASNQVVENSSKPTQAIQSLKKFKPLPKGQMLLDAGQKKFGVTECGDCKFVYHMGDPSDELMHFNYHNARHVLRFNGWKDEHIVSQFPNARIIRVLPSDPKPWLKKVKELLDVVNRDLGDYDMPISIDNTQVYLYIKNKTIVGCLVAESKTTAFRLLSQNSGIDLCSEESYPVKCGVARIWVLKTYRHQGIGTSMLNSLRSNFMFGNILSKNNIAFSSPTELGKVFASKYFDNPNFLIYTY